MRWMMLVVTVLALAACGGPPAPPAPSGTPVPSVPGALPRADHVLVVIFENKGYQQVIGSAAAPYLTSLAHAGANFTDAHAERHPSQPNYLALLSGSTQGVTDDSCPQDLGDRPNLAAQLLTSGRTFAGYSEDLPAPGFTGCTGSGGAYARKHNPWVDFGNVPASANQPLAAMDYANLPTVAFVIPNMCHDMHDCSVAAGDAWAREHLPSYLDWAQTHNSLLIVTFDEDDGTRANHIPTIFAGPMVRAGEVSQRIDHYSILRTLEDMDGLPPLGQAANIPPITGIWRAA